MLLSLIEEIGRSWKQIAVRMGRTEAMARNRYARMVAPYKGDGKRQLCTLCGMLRKGHTCPARAAPPDAKCGGKPQQTVRALNVMWSV